MKRMIFGQRKVGDVKKSRVHIPEVELNFPRFENEESMSASEICIACHGCCHYVTVPLDPPRSREQKELFRWYLFHRNVEIYIDHEKQWQLLFKTPCDPLDDNGCCIVYENRPEICRNYESDVCSRVGSDHTHLFKSPADLEKFFIERDAKRKSAKSNRNTKTKSEKKRTKPISKRKQIKKV